ncbi:unnamed protein product [Arabis nemorensis]|uniref:Uncharacterized protein n=1 Tax=Arabis nemorensis TaxID=586526 RepID=A0A565C653_9BRAS|nr:unnamed protein product [Arabis nemorensis]
MFVSPWSTEFNPEIPLITSAPVTVELRGVPYLLFTRQSLSRIATALGKPVSLAPETERKKSFEVARMVVRVDLTKDLPSKVIFGFSNGREVEIDVSYPFLPPRCSSYKEYGHASNACSLRPSNISSLMRSNTRSRSKEYRHGKRSRPGRSRRTEPTKYVWMAVENQTMPLKFTIEGPPEVKQSTVLKEDVDVGNSATHTTTGSEKNTISPDGIASDSIEKHISEKSVQVEEEAPFFLVSRKQSGRKGAFCETHIQSSNSGRILRAIPLGWNFFRNFEHHITGRIVVVWDPSVSLVIYQASAQLVTCGIFIPAQNVSLTVSFAYGFNLVEHRLSLWEELSDINATTPVASHPWAVVGDFNQILRVSHHSDHALRDVDTSGMEDFNLALQDAELFEAQAKGISFTWWNNQDDDPISKKIDHSLSNQYWYASFPDSYAESWSLCNQTTLLVSSGQAWNPQVIQGTRQFKLVRSLKLLKLVLRRLNKHHYSGISVRVKTQAAKIARLQRVLLSNPKPHITRQEHQAREVWQLLLTAEEKFYCHKSRVRWAHLGDRNTPFFQKSVLQHAARNHIHFLKDQTDRRINTIEEIKAHSAGYFENTLGCIEMPTSLVSVIELQSLMPFRCSESQIQDILKQNIIRLHHLCMAPPLTHLLFANDLLVFSDGARHSLTSTAEVMSSFKLMSGLDMNASKSKIFFGGYMEIEQAVLSSLSGIKLGSFPTRYSGLSLNPARISFATLQPFIERVTSKLHSWTVKLLSFAGKITLISSVIYGMVNFWSAVFVLSKRFYEKIYSLCAAFLWKNRTTTAVGARVAWKEVCKPKQEGGLGIRLLEDFAVVFQLKLIWNLFSNAWSLWVAWVKGNIFQRKSFWVTQDSPRFSRAIRNMLTLKLVLQNFLRCELGDEKHASFWYDSWTALGPLIDYIGEIGPRQLRVRKDARVIEATRNDGWRMPGAKSERTQTFLLTLTTIAPPEESRGYDVFLWRKPSGTFSPTFSSKDTWEQMRDHSPRVPWCKNLVGSTHDATGCSELDSTAEISGVITGLRHHQNHPASDDVSNLA